MSGIQLNAEANRLLQHPYLAEALLLDVCFIDLMILSENCYKPHRSMRSLQSLRTIRTTSRDENKQVCLRRY